ncbi:hypothetical protein DQ353_19215 [Arthrobacter sp. AQ5-05]|uniref:hypothetical protein n=1 Tax=Arthrobacter sp. AQ5-05 TaxID=2184581 RepID=UPI000DCB7C24|nr:hypothetical protein [Arthrobacter sp. AQ5-05]RAX47307.1 hypothetical protein DQ353_19215 [Arthrobacter sp. AQ5-05]
MSTTPPSVQKNARRKLSKFLKRSRPGLGEPIINLRDASGRIPILEVIWKRLDDDTWRINGFEDHQLDKRQVDSTLVECRVFFTSGEDCYLPGIVTALQSLVTPEQAKARRFLKQHVAQVVSGSRIGASGPIFHSGRLEMDNGLGPGILLGSDLIAMDYIYGIALHEDDERLARIGNVSIESALQAVVYHFNDLLHVIANLRTQVEHDLQMGYFELET